MRQILAHAGDFRVFPPVKKHALRRVVSMLYLPTVPCLSSVVILQKAVRLPFGLPARHGIQADGMNAVEDALFNIRIILFEPFEQLFDLLPL